MIVFLVTGAQTVSSAARTFGEGSTPYMVDRVNCNGSEEILAECSHLGVNIHNCRKFQEAGVRCGKNKSPHTFSVSSVGSCTNEKKVYSVTELEYTFLLTF